MFLLFRCHEELDHVPVLAVGQVALVFLLIGVLAYESGEEFPEALAVVLVLQVGHLVEHDGVGHPEGKECQLRGQCYLVCVRAIS